MVHVIWITDCWYKRGSTSQRFINLYLTKSWSGIKLNPVEVKKSELETISKDVCTVGEKTVAAMRPMKVHNKIRRTLVYKVHVFHSLYTNCWSTGNNYTANTACTKEIEVHICSEIQMNEVGNCGENG